MIAKTVEIGAGRTVILCLRATWKDLSDSGLFSFEGGVIRMNSSGPATTLRSSESWRISSGMFL
jgi:hypothetical protein